MLKSFGLTALGLSMRYTFRVISCPAATVARCSTVIYLLLASKVISMLFPTDAFIAETSSAYTDVERVYCEANVIEKPPSSGMSLTRVKTNSYSTPSVFIALIDGVMV